MTAQLEFVMPADPLREAEDRLAGATVIYDGTLEVCAGHGRLLLHDTRECCAARHDAWLARCAAYKTLTVLRIQHELKAR